MPVSGPLPTNDPTIGRPGWPEVVTALGVYIVAGALIVLWLSTTEASASFKGIAGMAANGVAGTVALLAAIAIRLRNWQAFGFRPTTPKWIFIGVGLGLFAFAASFAIEHVYWSFIPEENTQDDFVAAAKSGLGPLLILVAMGGILTPLGEEFVFRGVIATALNRFGAWIAVVGSAAIFGIAHGPSVIAVLAFMIGLFTGLLYRRTGSIWPAIAVHIVYNSLHLFGYAIL